MLELKSVCKTYSRGMIRVSALRHVSLQLMPGEFIALRGPSGSGKSTLLNIAGLTEAPSEGDVILNGARVDFASESSLLSLRKNHFGYLFQYFNLLQSLTALENVAFSLVLQGEKYSHAEISARELLTRVGLAERCSHFPSELSGGEMQRVAVCRALIHRPRIILADEPTGNLDRLAGDSVLELLREATRSGTSVLMATHSAHAASFCSRHVFIADGTLCAAPQDS